MAGNEKRPAVSGTPEAERENESEWVAVEIRHRGGTKRRFLVANRRELEKLDELLDMFNLWLAEQ